MNMATLICKHCQRTMRARVFRNLGALIAHVLAEHGVPVAKQYKALATR